VQLIVGQKSMDTAAFLMSDTSGGMSFTTQISKEDAVYVMTGDPVTLKSGDQVCEELTVLSTETNEDETVKVTVYVPKDTFTLGAYAFMELAKQSEEYGITIPVSAVHTENERNFVYVMEPEETVIVLPVDLVEPLSEGDAQALLAGEQQEDAAAFTVWGELADRHISDPDFGRSVKADVIILRGDCELILPQTAVLASEDEKGCLIGEKTAWELFGSTKVVGDEVCIGTEARSIRGVVHRPEEGVIVMGSLKGGTEDTGKEEAPCYDRVTLSSKKAADGEAFLMQNGLEGAVLRFDYLRNLSWISGLVPGKWSDFSGWKDSFARKKQDFRLISQISKNSVELYYERQCRRYVWETGLEVVCVAGIVCICSIFKKRIDTVDTTDTSW